MKKDEGRICRKIDRSLNMFVKITDDSFESVVQSYVI